MEKEIEEEEGVKGYEWELINKEADRLNRENWELKQRVGKLENYIKFKSLWEDFEEVSK